MSEILIVDDEIQNAEILQTVLSSKGYSIKLSSSGEKALDILSESKIDLAIVDIMMPGMNGIDLCKLIKQKFKIPVIIITAASDRELRVNALTSGADEFINKPIEKEELMIRVKNLLYVNEYTTELETKVKERTQELQEALANIERLHRDTVGRLLTAAEFRDDETGKHIIRMSKYSRVIAEELGWSEKDLDLIEQSAAMHDVGKIGIPDNILLKPGKLTTEEFEIMKKHTLIGARILSGSNFKLLQMAQEIALTHHEKFDGSGYPQGLKGKSIPLTGRIVTLSDVFDALVSKRPYKPAFDLKTAIKIMKDSVGKNFDKDIITAFFQGLSKIENIKEKYADLQSIKSDSSLDQVQYRR